jgi:hypothetical protein
LYPIADAGRRTSVHLTDLCVVQFHTAHQVDQRSPRRPRG